MVWTAAASMCGVKGKENLNGKSKEREKKVVKLSFLDMVAASFNGGKLKIRKEKKKDERNKGILMRNHQLMYLGHHHPWPLRLALRA